MLDKSSLILQTGVLHVNTGVRKSIRNTNTSFTNTSFTNTSFTNTSFTNTLFGMVCLSY